MSLPRTTPAVPPRWFVRSAWAGHKLLYRTTGLGLSRPVPERKAGILRLHTVGRRTGRPRAVMLCYFLDGEDVVTLAMNGWAADPPAWWLNLQAHPDVRADTADGELHLTGRAAVGAERERLLARFDTHSGWGDVRAHVAARPDTPVVVLARA